MSSPPGRDLRAAVLKHPFFLAGLSVVALLGLTAAVLVVADSIAGSSASEPTVVVSPATTTPGPVQSTAIAGGVIGTTRRTTTVRTMPGSRGPIAGIVRANTDVEIDGRTTDATWLRIVYPPNSELHGWVDAEDLEIVGDPESLVVATAEPPVIIDLPTQPPLPTQDPFLTPEVTGTPDLTATVTGGLPDLVIGTPPNVSQGILYVTVVNQGVGQLTGDLVVAVFNEDGSALLGGATLPGFNLAPGRSIDIGTGYAVQEDERLLLVVDPNGTVDESDNTNNRVVVEISLDGGLPPITPTPDPGAGLPPEVIATLVTIATQTAEAQAGAAPPPP
jgi:hypothetical protein